MVNVGTVGQERILATTYAAHHYPNDIETGHNEQCKSKDQRIGQMEGSFGMEHAQTHGQQPQDESDSLAATVAHKYFIVLVGTAEHIEAEERNERAKGGKGDECIDIFADKNKDTGHKEEGHTTQTAGQSVDTVYQIDGVDAIHNEQHTQGHTYPIGYFIHTKKTVKVVDPYAGKHNHDSTDNLYHELSLISHPNQIVGNAFEVEQHHGTEREGQTGAYCRHIGSIAQIAGQGRNAEDHTDTEQDGGRKSYSSQTGNNAGVHLALVDGVEEFLFEGDKNDFGNNQRGDGYAEQKS